MAEIFLVGGAVRNIVLGLPIKDRDFVVVGSTEEEMLAKGFKKVGQDFPVFLDDSGEEYALARREISTGNGYKDFSFEFGPDVTLEEDLFRRDMTCNSLAQNMETGDIVDPFGGLDDIKNRVFRMVSETSFEEDPVRILRLARFCAEYPAFSVDPATRIAASKGNIMNATAERVNLELMKALKGAKPSRFFEFLNSIDQLDFWFPEIFNLIGKTQPLLHHLEGCAFVHTMMVVDEAAKAKMPIEVMFSALVHDFGKGTTPVDLLPKHHGHEERGVPLVATFVKRLKIENDLLRVGQKTARFHTHVHNVNKLNAKTFVKVFEDMKSHINDVDVVGLVAMFDGKGKLPVAPDNDNHLVFARKVRAAASVKLSNAFTNTEIETMSIENRIQKLHKMRVAAVTATP